MNTLLIDDELLHSVENVLTPDETVSQLVATLLREEIDRRADDNTNDAFLARGAAALDEYHRSGVSSTSEQMAARLRADGESGRAAFIARRQTEEDADDQPQPHAERGG